MCAVTSLMIGAPVHPGFQPIVANLSALFVAKMRQTSSWSSPSMVTQNAPALWILGQIDEFLSGRNQTSGGSSDTDVNDPIAKPTGEPSNTAITITTPVGKWPSTCRNFALSKAVTASDDRAAVRGYPNETVRPSEAAMISFGTPLPLRTLIARSSMRSTASSPW